MDKSILLALGNNINKIRKLRKITQEQLALLSHLSKKHISIIERGKTNPTIKTIYKISVSLRKKLYILFSPF